MVKQSIPRTVIEFKDCATCPTGMPTHKVRRVLVNGTPVLVEKDGVEIEFGGETVTTVTLRIIASEVHFH